MSFTNGSLTVQGIQVNLPAIGSVKQGPFMIPYSDQFSSVQYGPNENATVTIPAGFNGLMVIPNNINQEAMTIQFALGDPSPVPYISPEYVTVITFDQNNYPSEYQIMISNVGEEQANVVLF